MERPDGELHGTAKGRLLGLAAQERAQGRAVQGVRRVPEVAHLEQLAQHGVAEAPQAHQAPGQAAAPPRRWRRPAHGRARSLQGLEQLRARRSVPRKVEPLEGRPASGLAPLGHCGDGDKHLCEVRQVRPGMRHIDAAAGPHNGALGDVLRNGKVKPVPSPAAEEISCTDHCRPAAPWPPSCGRVGCSGELELHLNADAALARGRVL